MTPSANTHILFEMPGYHICHRQRGRKLTIESLDRPTPLDSLLKKEQIYIVLTATASENDKIYQAILLILQDGHTMAEACSQIGIRHQSELLRAIHRIARKVQTIMS